MKISQPWFRASRDQWFVQLDRKQIPLAKGRENEAAAWTEFHRLMHERGRILANPSTLLFGDLAEDFLAACLRDKKRATYDWYRRFLPDFGECFEGLVVDLTPNHVIAWLAKYPKWSPATQRAGIVAVKAVIGWGLKNRRIKEDPLLELTRPDAGRREICAGAADLAAIVGATDTAFAAFALAIRETGARPGEVRMVEARHFDAQRGTWVFQPAECLKKSRRARVFYLTPAMLVLSAALAEAHPAGPMFRNRLGKPWTANAVRIRMRRLRAKGVIPAGMIAYSFRHGFATDALAKGVTNVELAQLMGHRDTRMIDEHYGHLDQRAELLKAAARKAVS
jgi:integrase